MILSFTLFIGFIGLRTVERLRTVKYRAMCPGIGTFDRIGS